MTGLEVAVEGIDERWYQDTADPGDPPPEYDFLWYATYRVSDDRFTIEYSDEDGRRWRVTYRIQPLSVE